MRSVDEHVAAALALVSRLDAATVPLSEALGLVLAEPIIARVDSPPFDNSAMDGFATKRADIVSAAEHAPVRLRVVGESAAGSGTAPDVTAGCAVRIMTGAPLPRGAEVVVPVEMTRGAYDMFAGIGSGDQTVEIVEIPQRDNIRRRAEDVTAGEQVVGRGTTMGPAQLAAAASVGVPEVAVVRRPVVAILATGDELVTPGQPLKAGHIYDSNSVVLAASVSRHGGVPVVLRRVGDSRDDVVAALRHARADLIVTSGGVSAGVYDVVKGALAGSGVEFSKVAMQPGKPQGLGVLDGTPVACLPGNPVSSLVSFEAIVTPMLRVMRGLPPHRPPVSARVARGWQTPPARQQYMPVRTLEDGSVIPATDGGSGSHLVARLAGADALAVVAASVDVVVAGDTVSVIPLAN